MPRLLPSLKVRIALITTVLAAILGGGIVIGSLYFAHLDLEDALQNQQDSIVKLSVDQLDTAMDDRIELLSTWHRNCATRSLPRMSSHTMPYGRRYSRQSTARYRCPRRSMP
jgi:hypothetical protein